MKQEKKNYCTICHSAIETRHVFTENNQVFLKHDSIENMQIANKNKEEWHPINFQWIPVIKLNENLNKLPLG